MGAWRNSAPTVVGVFLLLVLRASADTSDIHLRLFTDRNCFGDNLIEERTLLNEGCYANTYTTVGAFSLKIVDYVAPQSLDITLYPGACNAWDWSTSKRQIVIGEGQCTPFPSSTSQTYAEMTLRERSSICGGDASCSDLVTVQQQFYTESNCNGAPLVDQYYEYPASAECLTTHNGTMRFTVRANAPNNITQTVFEGSQNCGAGTSGAATGYVERTYGIQAASCYNLYSDQAPRSFMWSVYDVAGVFAANSATPSSWRSWSVSFTVMLATAVRLLRHE